jgi:hypothetical protein
MRYFIRRSVLVAGLALVGLALLAPAAQAQPLRRFARPVNVVRPFTPVRAFAPVNFHVSGRPFPVVQNRFPAFVPTQLQRDALRNWSFQTRVIGNTYGSLPPWLFGYNPYVPLVNVNPVYSTPWYPPVAPAYANPYSTYVNPFATFSNPYSLYTPPVAPTPTYSGTYANPYAVY